MIYFIKNVSINNKKLKLLKSEEIKKLNDIFQIKNNFLPFNTISNFFNIEGDEKNEKIIKYDGDNGDNSSESDLEENNSKKDENLKDLVENLNGLNLEENLDFKYYLSQIIKDIDLESINNDILNEINNI